MNTVINQILLAILIIFCFSLTGIGQEVSIKGKIITERNENIPYATISVLNISDSIFVKGTTSNEDGLFTLSLDQNKYIIKIGFLSYLPYFENIESGMNNIDLGEIILKENPVLLDQIEVRAERSTFTTSLDKRIFNVGKDLSSRGGNASDVLDNVPSVNVDVEGNISLRGSTNVRILIDGKESVMISDGGAFLRQLPANMIKQIEVITNPSARYQADGETGIINIVLQKNNQKKINGSIEASLGNPAQHGISYLLNWRNNKIGLSSSYGILYKKFQGGGSLSQNFIDEEKTDYTSNRTHQRGGLNHNIKLGLDLFINKSNTINIIGLLNPRTADNGAKIKYDFIKQSGEPTTITREDVEEETAQRYELSITHTKVLSSKKHTWTNTFSMDRRDDIENNIITETSNTGSRVLIDIVDNREDAQNILLQTDYVHPYSKEGSFELGLKITSRLIENEFQVQESKNGSDYIILDKFDNLFRYTSDIYSAYIMTGNKLNQWSYQIGLRVEHSEILTELTKSNVRNPRSYTQLFPSGLLGYMIDDNTDIQLSYSKRITRPRLWHLFPFFTFSDSRNLLSGNPNLNPELTHSAELSWIRKHNSGSILAAIVYRHSNDVVQRISIENEDQTINRIPINIATKDAYGVELTIGVRPKTWWKINANSYMAYEKMEGVYENIDLSSSTFNVETKISSDFHLSKNDDLKLSFNHQSPRNRSQGYMHSRWHINIAASHKLLNNKASFSLSIQDLFNTRKRRSETNTASFYQESEFQWRERQVILNFRYRIGNSEKNKKSKR